MEKYSKALIQRLAKNEVDASIDIARRWVKESSASEREISMEMAKAVAVVYRSMLLQPVQSFLNESPKALPSDIATTVNKAMARLFRISEEWETKIRLVYNERLARELRDYLKFREFDKCLHNLKLMCTPKDPRSHEEILEKVQYVGGVLGTCVNHKKEAQQVLKETYSNAQKYGLDERLVLSMKDAYEKQREIIIKTRQENAENQWVTELKRVQVDVMNEFPPKNVLGEPEEDQLRDIGDVFRSVARVAFDAQIEKMLIDATLVLIDFCPKDTAGTAKAAGIEERAYKELGPRARKAAAHTFMDLGKNKAFTTAYLRFARKMDQTRYFDEIIEFMGALRTETYSDYFKELWEDKSKSRSLRDELSMSLSNLASPDAAASLMQSLEDIFAKKASSAMEQLKRLNEFKTKDKSIDPTTVKRATTLLKGLGRIIRSPRSDDALRRQIVAFVVETVPQDDRRLGQAVVTQVLAARPDVLGTENRKWAIAKLVEALWIQDQSTDMHEGGERERTIIGDRQTLIVGLRKLGKADIQLVIDEMSKYAMRFSMAFVAAAELFQDLKEPRAIPLLVQMLGEASLFDPKMQTSYQGETYWDPTEQKRKNLTRDLVVAPLIYAIAEIDGPDAKAALNDYNGRVQMGRLPRPGPEGMKYLADYLGKFKGESAAEEGTPEDAVEDAPAVAERVDPDEVRKLIKAISGSYFMKSSQKRMAAKVPAFARLGQLTPVDALPDIMENLAEKEQMIASAAITCLAEYAVPSKPKKLMTALLNEIEGALSSKDAVVRQRAVKVVTEIGPSRAPVQKWIARVSKLVGVDYPDVRIALERAAEQEVNVQSDLEAMANAESTPNSDVEDVPKFKKESMTTKRMNALEQRRAYMQARQDWIKGGKQGDPPVPPDTN